MRVDPLISRLREVELIAAVAIIVWLIGVFISLFILHAVIQSAINGSELTKTLKEISEHLKSNPKHQVESEKRESDQNVLKEAHSENVSNEICPGCGFIVRSNTKFCPSCDLRLNDD
jgi:predicted PurR-regulated permease PerM